MDNILKNTLNRLVRFYEGISGISDLQRQVGEYGQENEKLRDYVIFLEKSKEILERTSVEQREEDQKKVDELNFQISDIVQEYFQFRKKLEDLNSELNEALKQKEFLKNNYGGLKRENIRIKNSLHRLKISYFHSFMEVAKKIPGFEKEAYVFIDANGRVRGANDKARKIAHYDGTSGIGKKYFDFINGDTQTLTSFFNRPEEQTTKIEINTRKGLEEVVVHKEPIFLSDESNKGNYVVGALVRLSKTGIFKGRKVQTVEQVLDDETKMKIEKIKKEMQDLNEKLERKAEFNAGILPT